MNFLPYTRGGWSDPGVLREMAEDPYQIEHLDLATIVDIGANIGGFCVKAARLNPLATIDAYEPDLDNWSYLTLNIADYPNIHAYNTAVWEHDNGVLLTPGEGLAHVCLVDDPHFCKAYPDHEGIPVRVPSITLDEILDGHTTVDCVKLDVEGAEFQILHAASDTTLNKIRYLRLELHDYFGYDIRNRLHARLSEHFHLNEPYMVLGHGGIWLGEHR